MRISLVSISFLAGIAGIGLLAGCGAGGGTPLCCTGVTAPTPTPAVTTAPAAVYQQTELLSRPAVKEAFESFMNHDTTNRTEPYSDPTLQSSIGSFTTTVAGRSAATAAALQSILYPNEMQIDL
jgi:hypothetical protein